MDHLKAAIARGVLKTLFGTVPAHEARVATFGGLGVEAGIWTELGIQPDNGWLIERSKKAQRSLMDMHPFQIYCSNLSRFPQAIREKRGNDAGLDLFHWDLSGTVDSVSKELPPVLPLLVQGDGRLLGVTYADSRFNSSLKEHEITTKVAQRVFGEKTFALLFEKLVALYRQEPVDETDSFITSPALREKRSQNTALREIGALLHLLFACASMPGTLTISSSFQTPIEALHQLVSKKIELRQFWRVLGRTRLSLEFELVERVVYISRYSDFSTRMRFFLFRLSRREGESPLLTELGPTLAKQFTLSPCRYLHGNIDISLSQTQETQTMDTSARTPQAVPHAVSPAPAGLETSPTETRPLGSDATSRHAEVDAIMTYLGPMLALINPDFARHVRALEVLARAPEIIRSGEDVLLQIRELIDRAAPPIAQVATSAPSVASTTASAGATRPQSRQQSRRDLEDLPLEVKDEMRLQILREAGKAKAEGKQPADVDKRVMALYQKLATEHGLGRARNRGRIFGGLRARSNGKYRGSFLKRLVDKTTNTRESRALLKELAGLYEVTVSTLEAEIAAATPTAPEGSSLELATCFHFL